MNDLSLHHLPPQNLEVEEAILTLCMLSPSEVDDICDLLKPEDFYRVGNQKIFKAISDMAVKKISPDLPALTNHLRDKKQLEEIGGSYYLSNLINKAPLPTNTEYYCKIIRNKAALRGLIATASNIVRSCYEDSEDAEILLDAAQKDILAIEIEGTVKDYVHIKDMIEERIDFYEERYNSKSVLTGVPSGLSVLDDLTAGFQKTDLILLAGRASHGKTALALNVIRNIAKNGGKAGIFTLEMSKEQDFDRLIAIESELNSTKFRTGRFQGQDDWLRVTDAMSRMADWKILFEELSFDLPKIIRKSRKMKKDGVDIIFYDYLSLIEGDKSQKRHEEVAGTARALKRLAKELRIPLVLLVQLNRDFRGRSNKEPILSDLRESGELEQAADVVMFIYRKELDTKDGKDENKADLVVAKQRNGPLGRVWLQFNKYTTRFGQLELTEPEQREYRDYHQ